MSDLYEQEFNDYVKKSHILPIEQIGFSLWEYLCKYDWSNESIEQLADILKSYVEKDRMLEGVKNDDEN